MKNHFFLFLMLIACLANAQLKPVAYTDAAQKLNGFASIPKNSNAGKPGILILPAWKGIDNHAKDSAEKLAALGYYAFVADIYGEGNYPKNNNEAGERAGFFKKNYSEYQHRISLA